MGMFYCVVCLTSLLFRQTKHCFVSFSVTDLDAALPNSESTMYIMKLTLNQGRNSGDFP